MIRDFKKILNSQDGIAFMMVIMSIVILTALMADFSFDSNINKLKAYNIQDRAQAKLNAEAALNFGMARLKLYKEAYNIIQKNESAKGLVNQQLLNSIWNTPFAYPIPIPKDLGAIEKGLIKEFEEKTVIDGEFLVTIQNVSQKMNLNLLQLKIFEDKGAESSSAGISEFDIRKQIQRTLEKAIEDSRDKNREFYNKYSGLNSEELVKIIEAYVSAQEYNNYPGIFDDNDGYSLAPKYAPFNSFSELYTLPKWPDELIDVLKNEYSAYSNAFIDINNINKGMLALLFPSATDNEIEEYFKVKNDPDAPKFFNSLEEFKSFVVNKANIVTSLEFDDRIKQFRENSIVFGTSPSLFKIVATGIKNRAKYNLEAIVSIPEEPLPIRKNPENKEKKNEKPGKADDPNPPEPPEEKTEKSDESKKKAQLFLEPRIIDIFIN